MRVSLPLTVTTRRTHLFITFSRTSQAKPSLATGILGGGSMPNYTLVTLVSWGMTPFQWLSCYNPTCLVVPNCQHATMSDDPKNIQKFPIWEEVTKKNEHTTKKTNTCTNTWTTKNIEYKNGWDDNLRDLEVEWNLFNSTKSRVFSEPWKKNSLLRSIVNLGPCAYPRVDSVREAGTISEHPKIRLNPFSGGIKWSNNTNVW